jgi:hypothetical protein
METGWPRISPQPEMAAAVPDYFTKPRGLLRAYPPAPFRPPGGMMRAKAADRSRGTGTAYMNLDEIYVKTELGLKELVERKMGVAIDVRRLLILIDGKHTVAQILARGRAFHADVAAFEQLERAGLIARLFSARSKAQLQGGSAERSADEVERFIAVQKALSNAINEHLGLRGYGFILRLQKTENLRDIHEMLPDFAQSLVKRKGMAVATPIVTALEQMIVRKA